MMNGLIGGMTGWMGGSMIFWTIAGLAVLILAIVAIVRLLPGGAVKQ